MATKNTNITITFQTPIATLLSSLAEQEDKSISSLAQELILEALERREDMVLSALAQVRDNNDSEPVIGHDEAWK